MARGQKKNTAPERPAAVSGPGALSQRTDAKPPTYASPAGERPYGERQAIEQQAQAAPMWAERMASEGAFGPTERPQEPATAGAPFGPGRTPQMQSPVPDDPDVLIRAMLEVYDHPALRRLLNG